MSNKTFLSLLFSKSNYCALAQKVNVWAQNCLKMIDHSDINNKLRALMSQKGDSICSGHRAAKLYREIRALRIYKGLQLFRKLIAQDKLITYIEERP